MASKLHIAPPAERAAAPPLIIQRKLTVPPLAETRVPRPRVELRLAELIGQYKIVVVSATAGSGKTTAAAAASELAGLPVAWLTIDRTDVAQGRLLVYLEATLSRVAPHLAGLVTGALGQGLAHVEVAGLLADALGEPSRWCWYSMISNVSARPRSRGR